MIRATWSPRSANASRKRGVLLATDDGGLIADGHPALAHRHAVHDGTVDLLGLCADTNSRPAVDDLVWVSRWVTPVGEGTRRFDTRFFVAVAPPGQTSRARRQRDHRQPRGSARPTRCDTQANGELTMMPPTIKSLELLDTSPTRRRRPGAACQLARPTAIRPNCAATRPDESPALPSRRRDYADLD